MKYEYKVLGLQESRVVEDAAGSVTTSWMAANDQERMKLLNALGQAGWELISTQPSLIFKKLADD